MRDIGFRLGLRVAIVVLFAHVSSFAGTVSLRWDPVAGATGYRVYYGTATRSYTTGSYDAGGASQATVPIPSSLDCTTLYLAVKAYNASGESAQFSNEVAGWSRPSIGSASIAAALQQDQTTLRLSGANFQAGATVEITSGNPRVFFETPRVVTGRCDAIDVALSVAPTYGEALPALAGTFNYTVTVTNPDGVYQTSVEQLEVRVDPSRFNLATDEASTRTRLDEADLAAFSRVFGSHNGDGRYAPAADFNGDLDVDGIDLALAFGSGLFGMCWNGSTYTIAACPVELK